MNGYRATYSPDSETINRKLKQDWIPAGLDMKGVVHSHPGNMDRLSAGDLRYIGRLLDINKEMTQFAAPLVLPLEFRLAGFIVGRDRVPQRAQIILF